WSSSRGWSGSTSSGWACTAASSAGSAPSSTTGAAPAAANGKPTHHGVRRLRMAMSHNPAAQPKLIVALDFADAAAALSLAARLDPSACAVKVGKELFVAAGPELVRQLTGLGFRVFLDLKFHDIPVTVARAC